MLEDERKNQDNNNNKFIEILFRILKFLPKLTISLWKKIINYVSGKNEENSNKKINNRKRKRLQYI